MTLLDVVARPVTARRQSVSRHADVTMTPPLHVLATARPAIRRGIRRAAPLRRSAVGSAALLMAGALALFFVLYALVLSGLSERSQQQRLYDRLRQELAEATAPVGGVIDPGSPIALISAPTAGLRDVVVVEGTSSRSLQAGPGHRRDTPMPGQTGVSVLYGRGVTFGAPFAHVSRLHKDSRIDVTTGQGTFHYRVIGVRTAGQPLPAAVAKGGSRLTLVTATSSGWSAGLSASSTMFVDAQLDGAPQQAVGGRLAAVPASERAMGVDLSTLFPLVLLLQAALAVAMAVAWAGSKWNLWATWLTGTPVILALLWAASGTVFGLLPNLF